MASSDIWIYFHHSTMHMKKSRQLSARSFVPVEKLLKSHCVRKFAFASVVEIWLQTMTRIKHGEKTVVKCQFYLTRKIRNRLSKLLRYNCGFRLYRKNDEKFSIRSGKFWFSFQIFQEQLEVKVTNVASPLEIGDATGILENRILKLMYPRLIAESIHIVTKGKFQCKMRLNLMELCLFLRSRNQGAYLQEGRIFVVEKLGGIFIDRNGRFESRGINNQFALAKKLSFLFSELGKFKYR